MGSVAFRIAADREHKRFVQDLSLVTEGEARRAIASAWEPDQWVQKYIRFKPGQGPTEYQLRSLRRLAAERRLAVRGPHGLGKTAMAAWAVISFAFVFEGSDWKVITTASVWRQLTAYLWPEVRKWMRAVDWKALDRAPVLDQRTGLLVLQLKLRTGEAFAVASNEPDKIEGAHADHLLYIFDEAKIIPEKTWQAAEGAFASGDCYALAISTPGEPSGTFYDIHRRKPGYEDWSAIAVTKEECIAAGRMDPEWAEQRRKQWGEKSEAYLQRVLGEFCSSQVDSLIPLVWVEAANDRWRAWRDEVEEARISLKVAQKNNRDPELAEARLKEVEGELEALGVDVAREGSDLSSCAFLRTGRGIERLDDWQGLMTTQTAGRVLGYLGDRRDVPVICDVIGNGAGVVDCLRDAGVPTTGFNAGTRTEMRDKSKTLTFANKRSAAWWYMRERLDPENGFNICLPPHDGLTGDLTAPRWRARSTGVIEVESKDAIRARIGRSTDWGDAVIHAYWPDRERPVDVW